MHLQLSTVECSGWSDVDGVLNVGAPAPPAHLRLPLFNPPKGVLIDCSGLEGAHNCQR